MLKLLARKITTEEVEVIPSTWQLSLEFGTPTQPGRCTVLPGVRDEAGEWRSDLTVLPDRLVIEDNLDLKEGEPLRTIATDANMAILDAVVQDGSFKGMTVRDMGAALIQIKVEGG